MKKIFIMCFWIGLCCAVVYGETVVLKSGERVQGKIIERTGSNIAIESAAGKKIYFYSEIADIIADAVPDTGESAATIVPKAEGQPQPAPVVAEKAMPEKKKPVPDGVTEPVNVKPPDSEAKTPQQIFDEFAPSAVVIFTQTPNGQGQGSGFFLESDGVIATNFHVLVDAQSVLVKTYDKKQYEAIRILGYDVVKDICLIKIDGKDFPVAPLGDSQDAKMGDAVFVIGAPLGYEFSISNGIVSGTRKFYSQNVIQFTSPILPGNSGGPVFNAQGQVIGMASSTNVNGQNLNFAVPVNDIKSFLDTKSIYWMSEIPKMSETYYLYWSAINAFEMQNYGKAIQDSKKAVELDPKSKSLRLALGNFYAGRGLYEEAIVQELKVLEQYPDDYDAMIWLATDYWNLGLYPDAIMVAEKLEKRYPDHLFVLETLGSSYCALEEWGKCEKYALKAYEIDPNLGSNTYRLAFLYYSTGKYPQAKQYILEALNLEPYNAQCNYAYSRIAYELGDYKTALDYFDKAYQLGFIPEPDFLEKIKGYARTQGLEVNIRKDPSQYYYSYDEDNPDNYSSEFSEAFSKAQKLRLAGDIEGSLSQAQGPLRASAKSSLEKKTADVMISINFAERGWNSYDLGQFDEAIKYYHAALNLLWISESDPLKSLLAKVTAPKFEELPEPVQYKVCMLYLNMGEVYLAKGQKQEAKKYLAKMKSLKTDLSAWPISQLEQKIMNTP